MSLMIRSATLSLAALLLIGCDENQLDSPDTGTQPSVNDRDYISPDAALPRPESARQPEYPVTPPEDTPAASQSESSDAATQPHAAGPGASTSPDVNAGTGSRAGAAGGTDAGADTATDAASGTGAGASASPGDASQDPPAPVSEEPAVEEVPADAPPSQN